MADPAPNTAPVQDQSLPMEQQQQQDQSQPMTRDAYGQAQQSMPPAAQPPRPAYGLPPQVTLKSGTFITMRINQALASNRNAAGDTFSGTLSQPVVVDGIVVAQRGQMVYGRVVEARKEKDVWRLGVELTSLTLADGSQAVIHTTLVSRRGPTTPGAVEAGVITSTTAGGAVVGAIAAGGTGAAAGAGIGAVAGIIGVLATHNHPSVIYPETMLTFQTQNQVSINTSNAGAYRYVGPDDYSRPTQYVQNGPVVRQYAAPYPYYPYPYWGGYPYWGFGPSIWIGGGWGWRGGFRR